MTMRRAICITALGCALGSALGSADLARAQGEVDHFAAGVTALAEGRYEKAIHHLEAWADRNPSHPDASYNRGLAYAMRAREDPEPGDLGRAAAAFEETLALRPNDEEAARALSIVRAEVTRRRSRDGASSLIARPSLDRIVIGLAEERTWGLLAIGSSFLLALALVLRRAREGALHLTAILLTPLAAVGLLLFLPLYLGARELRTARQPGVLVAREAYLSDENGISQGADPVPEAARLEVGERRGRLLEVRYGDREGYLPAELVRILRVR
jgi:tetratricopeptide (TPR) repeat protein